MLLFSLASNRWLRVAVVGIGAAVLLTSTVMIWLYLGLETNRRLHQIKASWVQFSEVPSQKGVWISEIRGLMGYGGIIHNFKNYVLRKDPYYLQRLNVQLADFFEITQAYRGRLAPGEERDALAEIERTIHEYESKIPIARQAAAEGWRVTRTDKLVKVDDTNAIRALERLENIWQQARRAGTRDVFVAVAEGERLITIGFVFLFGLAVVALILYGMLYALMRELHSTVDQLTDELAERKRAEQAEKKLSRAIEQSPATILITDTAGRIEYVNRKFEDLTEYPRAEVIGRTPAFLKSGDTSPEEYASLWQKLSNGEEWHGVFRNRRRSGGSYWAETSILPLKDDNGTIINFIGIGEDITERRRAKEQVARAQKMEAVGLLAGGIAHDFNNILTTIVGNAHLARLDAPKGSEIDEELGHIEIAAKRAQTLVKQLLTFARREPTAFTRLRIADVVAEVLRLLRASIPPTIDLSFSTEDDDLTVLGDATQLHQVLMNLCGNSAEAIGNTQGEVRIDVRRLTDEDRKTVPNLDPDNKDWLLLTLTDTGPGMENEIAARVFDPFFTTKPLGRGTGLGLSVVSNLVNDMGGAISLQTAPGEGACFSILLPEAEPLVVAADEAAPVRGGRERILLVDDEVDVVATYRRLLIRLGYIVDAYSDPKTALQTFLAAPDRFDAVVSDLIMPEFTGEELAAAIRRRKPDCPIIICTGYRSRNLDDFAGDNFRILEKPTDPDTLAATLRDLLDRSAGLRTEPAPDGVHIS